MEKKLTLEMVINRAKSDKFNSIKNLNLWGNELSDVEVVNQLPNLEVLSLSVNKISSLSFFASCPRLTELYLRKNLITDLSEIKYLIPLKQLRVLWLWDNPCSETPNYRLIVIKCLPSLVKLDNTEITAEEKQNAARINVDFGLVSPPTKGNSESVAKKNDGEEDEVRPIPRESYGVPKIPPKEESSQETRNENILCAVLSLLKELDPKSLELIRRDIDRKLGSKKV